MLEDLDKEEHTHGNNDTNEHLEDAIGLSDDDIQNVTINICESS